MWPYHYWFWWLHMPMTTPQENQCDQVNDRIDAAIKDLDEKHREHVETSKEVRHGAKNIRFLMQALLHRLEHRENEQDH